METPILFWAVRTEKSGGSSIAYLTAQEISQNRNLIGAVLGGALSESNAYVQTGRATFQSLSDWRRAHGKR